MEIFLHIVWHCKNKTKKITLECKMTYLGDNCIQIFHLGRYIVGYTIGNFVLRRRVSGAVKHDFRPYIRRYTTPNEKLNIVIPILMYFLTINIEKCFVFHEM